MVEISKARQVSQMSSSTLYRKYRPQGWSEVAGQEHVKDTLAFEVSSGRTVHAYLFSGPRGVGKTTTARIFAKAINCLEREDGSGEPCGRCVACLAVTEGGSMDIIEIDAASNRGIDSVRDNIIDNARFSPSRLKNKVFIVDEVHMLTTEAFNALLKTLEEPPANVVFLLATTELHKVPATIVSRCQRFDFRKIPVESVVDRLVGISAKEEIEVDREVLLEIARRSEGCLRDAEGLLGKVLAAADGERVTIESVRAVLPRSDWETAASFVEALLAGDTATALATVGGMLDAGSEPEHLANEALDIIRKTLIAKVSGDVNFLRAELDESRLARISSWMGTTTVGSLVRTLEVLLEKRRDMKGSPLPQLPLELAAVLICQEVNGGSAASAVLSSSNSELGGTKTDGRTVALDTVAAMKPAAASGDAGSGPDVVSRTEIEIKKTESNEVEAKEAGESEESALDKEVQVSAPEPLGEKEVVIEATAVTVENVVEESVEDTVTAIEIGSVSAKWEEIVKRVSEVSQSLSLLMGAVSPVRMDGNTVELGSCFPFHRDRLNEHKTRDVLETAFSAVLGQKLLVRAVTIERKPEIGHDDVAEGAIKEQVSPVEAAPAVQKIAEAFGGRVIS
ncbi:hypothetical protein COY93_04410 [Candidatus Uhrbacteria bacterium CG_4_10_14_0_8_um_filter_58_22]|uniref:DNA polymerase III subunit gamma/tau n=1 Tax=Candidatus Uhrbacteria bacterium CG_4_10_14_0_8_um_filter_58_22 TaxID=1975029 RepID=A0A2M7Q8X4_9BACT|nr:MAG: hypothetical protein COY93_04410 [Candidatus Uhrbacteria bacterium CG_4_10_14_0_8_um_filter_58_22]